MDTKLAFATALEVSPAELSCPTKASQPGDPSQYVIAWSGAFGLFILGLAMAAVVLLTGTNGTWEIASLSIVWDLTAVFSMIRHGAKQTYRLYNHTSWVVKYPKHAEGLNRLIVHANAGINNSYIVGVSASLITGVSLPFIPICLPKIWGAISLSPPNQQFTPSFSQSYGFDPTSIEWKACCNAKVKDDEDLRTGPVSLADEGSPTPPLVHHPQESDWAMWLLDNFLEIQICWCYKDRTYAAGGDIEYRRWPSNTCQVPHRTLAQESEMICKRNILVHVSVAQCISRSRAPSSASISVTVRTVARIPARLTQPIFSRPPPNLSGSRGRTKSARSTCSKHDTQGPFVPSAVRRSLMHRRRCLLFLRAAWTQSLSSKQMPIFSWQVGLPGIMTWRAHRVLTHSRRRRHQTFHCSRPCSRYASCRR